MVIAEHVGHLVVTANIVKRDLIRDPDITTVTGSWTRIEATSAFVRAERTGRFVYAELEAAFLRDTDPAGGNLLVVDVGLHPEEHTEDRDLRL